MPQLVELQTLYWGLLPVEPVPLMPNRVNALIGSNGSNKSTMLDAIKLLFGLTSFHLGAPDAGSRSAYDYVFRPPDEEGEPSGEPEEQALVKGVFLNPVPTSSRVRLFAHAGNGCDRAERVTVIARVRAGEVRWLVLDGHRTWGADGRDWRADVELLNDVPRKRWLSAAAYGRVLTYAGVSTALREVLRLGQGQAAAALDGDERDVLRHVVQMLGQQQALDGFNSAVGEHEKLRAALEGEQGELDVARSERARLADLVSQHRRWRTARDDVDRLTQELPFALDAEIVRRRRALADTTEQLETLRDREPDLADDIHRREVKQRELRRRDEELREAIAPATTKAYEATRAAEDARTAIGAWPDATDILISDLQGKLLASQDEATRTATAANDLEEELDRLKAGALRRPPALEQLLGSLRDLGLESEILAEVLEVDTAAAAETEARLGEAVWAVGIDASHWEVASRLVIDLGHEFPVVRMTDNERRPFDAFIMEIGVLADTVAVDTTGVLRGQSFVWPRAARPPRLGEESRRKRQEELERELPNALERAAVAQRSAAEALRQLEVATKAVAALSTIATLEAEEIGSRAELLRLQSEQADNGRDREEEAAALERARADLKGARTERTNLAGQMSSERGVIRRLTDERALLLPNEQASPSPESVRPLEEVRRELQSRESARDAFDDSAHDETLPLLLTRQEQRIGELEELIGGRISDIDALHARVVEARALFNERVRQLIPRLSRHFGELCQQADMHGTIRLTEPDEAVFGLEVNVRGTGGHHTVSLRSNRLSGGQAAKAALVLLLACMSLAGATDILVSDEPGAHLDAYNLHGIGDTMRSLADSVQIIISAPLDSEAERLDWSAHQISFVPTRPGDAGYPFVELAIMSAMPPEHDPPGPGGFDAL